MENLIVYPSLLVVDVQRLLDINTRHQKEHYVTIFERDLDPFLRPNRKLQPSIVTQWHLHTSLFVAPKMEPAPPNLDSQAHERATLLYHQL